MLIGMGKVYGQAPDSARVAQFAEERSLIQRLEGEIPEGQTTTWDFGGWYRGSWTKFDDLGKWHDVQDHDFRLWGSLSIQDVHQIYVRGRLDLIRWQEGDSFDGNDHNIEGPNLDQGWYRLRVAKAAERYLHQKWPVDVDVKVGRQYIEIGRGEVLSEILDAVTVDVSNFYFDAMVFGSQSPSHINNLDVSAPKWWHDRRDFAGFQGTLKNVIPKNEPYVFAVFVDDRNLYQPAIPGQGFGYNPNYFGFGNRGYLLADLRYWNEAIWETGRSHATGSTREEDISASAFVFGGEYQASWCPTHPRLETEYGWASGDKDRLSATNTINGNMPFTDDKTFLAYGYHDTGAAFAPRLANLSVLRVTGTFHPLDFWARTRNLEIGASWYWYEKDRKDGGISDSEASKGSHDLGTEYDVFATWRITSDLLWTVRYGKFFPGDAFVNEGQNREYLLTSLTYSF
jgi:hypothetical protein